MRFHCQKFDVVASFGDNIVEEKKRLRNCKCLRLDILIHLTTAVVFDGDLNDSFIVVKKQLAY
jgi:hypothetical protein